MAPDYGVVELIWSLIGGVGLVFAGLGWAAAGRAKGALFGVVLFLGLMVTMLVLIIFSGDKHERELNAMRADRKTAAEKSVAEVQKQCEAQERFEVFKPIKVGSSVFVNVNPEQKSPTAIEAPTVTPTEAMKSQQKRFGESFPPSDNRKQYVNPIIWIGNADRPEYIAEILHSDLVETNNWDPSGNWKYLRFATKQRWDKDGDSFHAKGFTETHIDERKFENWPDNKIVMPIPIWEALAQYVFEVDDISTMDDRQHWVARGRMRLSDARTSDVLAEYVGFQSILDRQAVCPKAKEASSEQGQWDMLRFFFERVTEKS